MWLSFGNWKKFFGQFVIKIEVLQTCYSKLNKTLEINQDTKFEFNLSNRSKPRLTARNHGPRTVHGPIVNL